MPPAEFPTDAAIDAAVARLADALGPDAVAAFARAGVDIGDHLRFEPLAAACKATREGMGVSLADVAKRLRVAQRRIRSIELSEVGTIDGDVLQRLVAFLEIEPFLADWAARYPDVADRVLPNVLTLRVMLDEVEPHVWRLIQAPSSFTFFDLHVAIQDAMGWQDSHLHEFRLPHPAGGGAEMLVGLPDEEGFDDRPTEPGWLVPIAPFLAPGRRIEYAYDFGDDWRHTIVCESRTPRDPAVRYPRCVAGARACPPEGVGGPFGYMDFLCAVRDRAHEQHREMLQWAGGSWDPEGFDPRRVRFSDAKARLRMLRAGG